MNYQILDELGKALQNISGKAIAETADIGSMLHAFNSHYVCTVTFTKTPVDAIVVVKKGTNVVKAEADGKYALKEGTYTYTATAEGYVSKEATALVITNADEAAGTKTVEVTLTQS